MATRRCTEIRSSITCEDDLTQVSNAIKLIAAYCVMSPTARQSLLKIMFVLDNSRATFPCKYPNHLNDMLRDSAKRLQHKWQCNVCFEHIEPHESVITACGHFFCCNCLKQWKRLQHTQTRTKWQCPACKTTHSFTQSEMTDLDSLPLNKIDSLL
jgi:rubrerythrin